MIGTPAAFIRSRASVFEPIASIASGGGPIQVRPAASTARANVAFSARKPYPGWTASAPALQRGLDDPLLVQVALGRRAAAEQQRLVGDGERGARRGPPPSRRRPMPISSSRSVRKIRIAISPRLATRTFEKRPIGDVFSLNGWAWPTS